MRIEPKGVCATRLDFDVDDEGLVRGVEFTGGCGGNRQAVARLVEGMPADKVIEYLSGIRCGKKDTSCPDQLAAALIELLNNS